MPESRQGKVTEEHREEARRLRAIWDSKRDDLKAANVGSQEAFGLAFGIGNQAAVGFFLNGKTALSLKAALGFARGLECNVSDFSPRLAAILDGGKAPRMSLQGLSSVEHEVVRLMRAMAADVDRAKLLGFAAALASGAGAMQVTQDAAAASRKRASAG